MTDRPLPDPQIILHSYLTRGKISFVCREYGITRYQFDGLLGLLGLKACVAFKRGKLGRPRGKGKSGWTWRKSTVRREKGIAAFLAGCTPIQVARAYGVTAATVYVWLKKSGLTYKDCGRDAPSMFTQMIIDDPHDPSKPPMTKEQMDQMAAWWDKAKADGRVASFTFTDGCVVLPNDASVKDHSTQGQFVTNEWRATDVQ